MVQIYIEFLAKVVKQRKITLSGFPKSIKHNESKNRTRNRANRLSLSKRFCRPLVYAFGELLKKVFVFLSSSESVEAS